MKIKDRVLRRKLKREYIGKIIHSTSFGEALHNKKLMEQEGILANKKVYYELLQKCSNSTVALELKVEIEERNISMTEEMYISLMKKNLTFDYRFKLLNEMEIEKLLQR